MNWHIPETADVNAWPNESSARDELTLRAVGKNVNFLLLHCSDFSRVLPTVADSTHAANDSTVSLRRRCERSMRGAACLLIIRSLPSADNEYAICQTAGVVAQALRGAGAR